MSNGLVLDKTDKMSKRLGNAIDPFETLQNIDLMQTRWYMISNANPWENLEFDLEGMMKCVENSLERFITRILSLVCMRMLMDSIMLNPMVQNRPEIDRWILSELNLIGERCYRIYEDYEPTKVARAINNFVNDNLSNWYVRLLQKTFLERDYSEDKISAYQTLYTCLETVAKISAPIVRSLWINSPRFERCWKDTAESVHLTDFPKLMKA